MKRSAFSIVYVTVILLSAACAPAPKPTAPPAATLVPSLTPSPVRDAIEAAVEGTLTAVAAAPTGDAPTEVTPEATPEPTKIVVTIEPLLGRKIPPPLDIQLPQGWKVGYDTLLMKADENVMRGVPLAVYSGPVTGGNGTIVLLWGFPNLVNPFPQGGTPAVPDLWADGLRLLRLAVFEQGCNIGTDLKRSYRVGLEPAVGTQFAAVTCPDKQPDTRGWFAGVQKYNLNFVFYVYSDPISAMDKASLELQAILDTVRFKQPEATPEATGETTAQP
jgi:hypothetical protein